MYAALTAVFAANIVLVGYIVTSILDDKKQRVDRTKYETKKGR
jgi:hypothetical protein